MTNSRKALAACCLVVLTVLAGPVAGASASKASIKAVFKSYSKIAIAEGHTLTALGEYKTTHNAVPVVEAITSSVSVITAVRSKVAQQSAVAPKVKLAKSKILKGLEAFVVAYDKLKTVYSDKTSSPELAQAEAAKAVTALKSGKKQLTEGALLLR